MASHRDPGVEVRFLRPGDDLDAQLDLAERAFGVKAPDERESWRQIASELIAAGRCLGAFAGDRLVGGAMFYDMRQWWCGQRCRWPGWPASALPPRTGVAVSAAP